MLYIIGELCHSSIFKEIVNQITHKGSHIVIYKTSTF